MNNTILELFYRDSTVHVPLLFLAWPQNQKPFSLQNSNNRGVATGVLYKVRALAIRKIQCLDQIWMNIELTNWTARLEFLCAFFCPLTLYHRWPSSKTLQSKLAPPVLPGTNLFSLTLKNVSRPQIGETDLSHASCLPAGWHNNKSFFFSPKPVP